jgi:hypothetical protein
MARLDGSHRGVLITEESARRIARAVQRIHNAKRDQPGRKFRVGYDDGGQSRLGKVESDWDKGTLATVTVYDRGTPPNEEAADPPETLIDCVNKFADIEANSWVWVTLAENGYWYVTAAECDPEEGSS